MPPTLDLAQHVRDLRAVALPALLIALLVAIGVFAVRMAAEPEYEASVLARVDTTAVAESQDTADRDTALRASYAEAITDTSVLNTIVARAAPGWTVEQARARITVADGPVSGLVRVTARGASSQQASAVVAETVIVLASAVRERRLSDAAQAAAELRSAAETINTQLSSLAQGDPLRATTEVDYQAALDRISEVESTGLVNLAALSDPTAPEAPVAPNPLRDALLALLVALILVAELLALLRGRVGPEVSAVAARRIAQRHGAGMQQVTSSGTAAAPIGTELLAARRLDAGQAVLVLHGPKLPAGGGLDLDELRPTGAGVPGSGLVVALAADGPWWRSSELANVGLAVVVVAEHSRTKPLIDRTLRALADTGVPAILALVARDQAAHAGPTSSETDRRTAGEMPAASTVRPRPTPHRVGQDDATARPEGDEAADARTERSTR